MDGTEWLNTSSVDGTCAGGTEWQFAASVDGSEWQNTPSVDGSSVGGFEFQDTPSVDGYLFSLQL